MKEDYFRLINASRSILDFYENEGVLAPSELWEELRDATYAPLKRLASGSGEVGQEIPAQIWRVYDNFSFTGNLNMSYWGNADHAGARDFKTIPEAAEYIKQSFAKLKSTPQPDAGKWTDEIVKQHMIDFGYWVKLGKGMMLGVLRKSMSELLDIYLDSEEYKTKFK